MSPEMTNPERGFAPSLFVPAAPDVAENEYRVVKLAPFVLTEKTVPFPEVPPPNVVPYKAFPEAIR